MNNSKKFMMIPLDIDRDPRLQPWLNMKGLNDREVIWAVERMISRLAAEKDVPLRVSDLLQGLNRRQISYQVLKDIVTMSGFFDYEDGYVKYDWERFAQPRLHSPRKSWEDDGESEDEMSSQSRPKVVPESSSTPARDLKATNVDKDIDVDVDNDEDKEKEKKEKAAARISQLVDEWVIDPTEENMPRREDVRRWMTWLLNLREGQAPYLLSKKCAIPNIKERWYDLVVSFAEHLALNGGFKRIKNYTEAQKYMSYAFNTIGRDEKLDKNFPGMFIQNQMKEEEETAHKAWVEEEKKRFPFEDYDPERGTRYVGNEPIPWDAPPRPDNGSRWDYEECRWVSLAEQEAAIAQNSESRRNAIAEFCRRKREREAVREL